ncbi:hypothetical protein LTSEGIV_3222 [Salmonella enterica subsp. enterica serovar Give str. S5-487]|nr:hypothetical protein LTSEGIV_3222 [Salmonella enterica subsp. enterica serovar Give str. S5-487]
MLIRLANTGGLPAAQAAQADSWLILPAAQADSWLILR